MVAPSTKTVLSPVELEELLAEQDPRVLVLYLEELKATALAYAANMPAYRLEAMRRQYGWTR